MRWGLTQQMEGHDETGENDGHGGTQLDEDVQGGAGGVLEGIAHGVSHHGGLVALGALAAVVPRAAAQAVWEHFHPKNENV